MSNILKLLDALNQLEITNEPAVLATVVKVEGSAYRRPGARMIIRQIGSSIGTVSGGCLESDLSKKAWWLTEGGEPVIRTYSTGVAGDDAGDEEELAFGLGCNGTVHILLERFDSVHACLPAALLRQIQIYREPVVLATVISSNSKAVKIGEHAAISARGLLNLKLERFYEQDLLMENMQATMEMRRTNIQRYRKGEVETEILLEYMPVPLKLVIFGAGHDAQPLVSMAKLHGWDVTVIDARRHFARRDRFPEADQVLNITLEAPFETTSLLAGAAVVIMTHSYSQDRHWLEQSLLSNPMYIGQLGPRRRTERLLDDIGPQSRMLPAYNRMQYPMGLDIGADYPESVALSVLAEIIGHMNGRDCRPLKDRTAPIHDGETAINLYSQKTSDTFNYPLIDEADSNRTLIID